MRGRFLVSLSLCVGVLTGNAGAVHWPYPDSLMYVRVTFTNEKGVPVGPGVKVASTVSSWQVTDAASQVVFPITTTPPDCMTYEVDDPRYLNYKNCCYQCFRSIFDLDSSAEYQGRTLFYGDTTDESTFFFSATDHTHGIVRATEGASRFFSYIFP